MASGGRPLSIGMMGGMVMNRKLLGAALAAALCGIALTAKVATANTISGVYSFTTSGFAYSGGADSPPADTTPPVTQITGSFGFTYTYAPENPPLPGNEPLIAPSSIDLTFGSTTFTTSDVLLNIVLYDVSQPVDPQGERLSLRLEALSKPDPNAGPVQRTGDYFLLDFALSPDGSVLLSLSNSPLFIYSLDNQLIGGNHHYSTNAVNLTCLPGECAS
jgi:hypothetical protein